jgi:hypothetical protein
VPGPEPALPPPVTVVDALSVLVVVGVVPVLLAVVTWMEVDMLPLVLAVVTGVVEAVPVIH